MKKVLKYILVFIILICIYLLSLLIVSCIPSNIMKENVKESANYFLDSGGEKNYIDVGYKNVCLFNFTNALMINTAYSIDSENPIESFLVARKNYIPGVTKVIHTNTSKDLMSATKYYDGGVFNGNAYQTLELYDTVNENDLFESFEYPRYWHGYLVYLRPLLTILNYQQISILSIIIFVVLLVGCAVLIYNKIGFFPAIALIISYLVTDLFIVSKSLNEIICFDLSLLFSIIILLKKDKLNIPLSFLIFGSLTNFLDFLTNPIVTYGIPIIIYFMIILKEEDINFKNVFFIYLKTSIAWFMGYALTWINKWIITDLILNRGVIKNAFEQVAFRTNIDNNNVSLSIFLGTLKFWTSEFVISFISIICTFTIIINFEKMIKNITSKKMNQDIGIITCIINFLIPVVWYVVLSQHSYIHMFFTYRNISIAFFALLILALELADLVYRKTKKKTNENLIKQDFLIEEEKR